MHTEWDTATRDNTLALYGVKRHTPAYYALRTGARAALIFLPVILVPHIIAYTLVPA